MRHPRGPTKKLAPMITPDTSCPHVLTEDEGMQLEIDCALCAGANDLSNNKCLAGVINVMSDGAEPETIVLKLFIHKRYRGNQVRDAARAATELSTLDRAIDSIEEPSDKQCRTCAASMTQICKAMRLKLLENPIQYVRSSRQIVERIQGLINVKCSRSRACVTKALSVSTVLTVDDP